MQSNSPTPTLALVERGQLTGLSPRAGPFELRPSDILIERFSAWKRLVKNLITYFEGIADIEVSLP